MGGMATHPLQFTGPEMAAAGELSQGTAMPINESVRVGPGLGDGVVVAPLGHRLPPGRHGQRQW